MNIEYGANLIPIMTSNTAPSGIASASSNVNDSEYCAFDGKTSTGWNTATNTTNGWLRYTFQNPTIVDAYVLTDAYGSNRQPKDWTFEGSNDGSQWTVLDTRTNEVVKSATKEYFFTNEIPYTSYRINVTANNGYNIFLGITGLSMHRQIHYENKVLVKNENKYLKFTNSNWTTVTTTNPTESDYINGNTLGEISNIPQSAWGLLIGNIELLYYTDNPTQDSSIVIIEIEPFSVYDHISETPEVLVYTESTDDIEVSTTTEPFDIYDELDDNVEVLYYTDDVSITQADLTLSANYSPLDELEGDFEVVTWSNEAPEKTQIELVMEALPKPQFVKLMKPKQVYGKLSDVFVNDVSQSFRNEARYFVASETPDKWYVWDKALKKFVMSDTSTEKAIMENGMTHEDLNGITDIQWHTWAFEYINIGMYLIDNPRGTIKTIVETISYEDYLPRHTQAIENTSLYILNTTAKIDISFNGNVLKGVLSDADLTRVQYRVLVNNGYYYPSDGSFTKLSASPQNIEVSIGSKDIKIDDWNTLKIEFQDFFGTTDYWSTQFMGTYSGLMFKDVYGQYYSSEIGEILQYLDFGIIIAGQTTIEHEVALKNQYGYDVKNVHLSANTANFPQGMAIEFSQSLSPFTPQPDLRLNGVLLNDEEMSFFIRLKSELGATPDANGSFDIIVRAEKA